LENVNKTNKKEEKKEHVHHEEHIKKDEYDRVCKSNTELNDKLLRLMAEMQNIKRHSEEEKTRLCKYDGEDLIKKLLPIVDNFERAIMLDDANLTDDLSKFLDGFKMIYGNIINILNEKNVHEIKCIDESFDPETMEAVLTEHVDGKEPGIVIDCLQKGYTYNDKVIRHAMVKVSE
jgi:molecular chaperone GrpE